MGAQEKQPTCQERVKEHLDSRTSDLQKLFRADQCGYEGADYIEKIVALETCPICGTEITERDRDSCICKPCHEELYNIGTFNEYGLSFDYVSEGTFGNQKEAYFRYQISWGGPSDEFRFFVNPNFSLRRIDYWFLDWYDGAHIELDGPELELMTEIFNYFGEVGTVQAEYDKEKEG